ncbi:hypothetical protein AKJ58_01550 [candidate division MSBL1 archaeon SCGC-AAA385D11]|uniref:EamA domain-containing protein n=1 Tax=candidate division MSBL1 archaeon SCGC-AAA385D11 TaxID=1698286 RepID=A0A133VN93_9EURY|nr:hypothetical protein AKJ58_01550 [candidate division MSBL1 archaeon SCGC-AAA385D11]
MFNGPSSESETSMMLWIYVTLAALSNGSAQLLLEQGMRDFAVQSLGTSSLPIYLFKMLTTPLVLAGIIAAGVSMLIWLKILTYAGVSYVFPIWMGLTFALVLVGSSILSGEAISALRIMGVVIIVTGVFITAMS